MPGGLNKTERPERRGRSAKGENRKETDMEIVLDEGYQFGLGVFETVCLEKGRPLFLSWHLERLHMSLKALGIGQTVTKEEVTAFLSEERLRAVPDKHALKIMVSAENKVMLLRGNPYTPAVLRQGFRLAYSPVYRNETSPLVYHKTMNYGDCILEKRRAKELGVDELIFKNSRGELCEGTTTNLFFVREGKLYTPAVSCGLLPGVVRRFLCTNFPVQEAVLTPKDVENMEECFVTNSLMGIMPVTSLAGKNFSPGPVTRQCRDLYQKEVQYFPCFFQCKKV